ncbi:MAG: Wzz/FepE/Etk N-terminal domain-containing protein [Rhodospirillaceae bacterium]
MTENYLSNSAFLASSLASGQRNARLAWRVVWRSKYLVLTCLMMGLLPAILFLQQATPRYSAEAKVMVLASETNDALSDRTLGMSRAMMNENVMGTEVELIGSQTLARRVVAKLQLDRDPEFNRKLAKPQALEQFFASINPLSWLARLSSSRNDPLQTLGPEAKESVERDDIASVVLKGLRVAAQRRSYIISIQYMSMEPEKAR